MQSMLDTDTCIYLIKCAVGIKPKTPLHYCCISAVVLGELEYGVANSARARREQNRHALLDFLGCLDILPVDENVSGKYGLIRAALKSQPIGPNDMWIAAHAISLNLPLVTNNIREFSRVPDLSTETWMTELDR
jgi:tRNA(fMet)-specific endonuclease VapC